MNTATRLLLAALVAAGVVSVAARRCVAVPAAGAVFADPICGGVLIASNVLLTSASCTVPGWGIPKQATLFPWLRIGVYPRYGGEYEIRFVTATLIHSAWDRRANPALNDIALMRLGGGKIPSVPSLMTPIRLPGQKRKFAAGTQMEVLGWGNWGRPNVPKWLQSAEVPLQSPEVCAREFPGYGKVWATGKNMCAGTKGKPQGICSGDYGGPLFIPGKNVKHDLLVGIGAYRAGGCGRGGLSGFTSVAKYRSWIDLGVDILKGKANATSLYRSFYLIPEPEPLL
ncbi:hypothetical protein CHLNCDRAFT_139992 [Chlorella variabilis]|uniref:Peptidase S1 domain-containing protein n=1 Tax=Chlorella variabilis TaxID=554065 RepID=E1ZRC3_CHLVA|nr:hypothetical protein CHLNCDRAFT_139992 [Chlorella variabilis]EFN51603.1 hypothetical protein CHLNCDRAFT_139992 [Chlorella variabilis]|eukprot:XP_005843705.1 hypothetical protein CHLNCDRAFT_139992 [Chlorella variabilis]